MRLPLGSAAFPTWNWVLGQILHVDLETSGLVRAGKPLPLLLEIACVLTDAKLRILDRYEAVIRHPIELLDALDPHPIVVEMHEKSGLWKDLREGPVTSIAQAEEEILAMFDRHPDPEGRPIVWAGFSPSSVDRPMVAAHMPKAYKRIHHRTLDVSSLKLAMLNYAGVEIPKTEAVHRAMADTLAETDLLLKYRTILRQLTEGSVSADKERLPVGAL